MTTLERQEIDALRVLAREAGWLAKAAQRAHVAAACGNAEALAAAVDAARVRLKAVEVAMAVVEREG